MAVYTAICVDCGKYGEVYCDSDKCLICTRLTKIEKRLDELETK